MQHEVQQRGHAAVNNRLHSNTSHLRPHADDIYVFTFISFEVPIHRPCGISLTKSALMILHLLKDLINACNNYMIKT